MRCPTRSSHFPDRRHRSRYTSVPQSPRAPCSWLLILALLTGCTATSPPVEAPSGREWALSAQGYHRFSHYQSQRSRTIGDVTITTRTTSTSSSYNNMSEHQTTASGTVAPTLRTGTNVADIEFNPELR